MHGNHPFSSEFSAKYFGKGGEFSDLLTSKSESKVKVKWSKVITYLYRLEEVNNIWMWNFGHNWSFPLQIFLDIMIRYFAYINNFYSNLKRKCQFSTMHIIWFLKSPDNSIVLILISKHEAPKKLFNRGTFPVKTQKYSDLHKSTIGPFPGTHWKVCFEFSLNFLVFLFYLFCNYRATTII